MDGYLRVSEPGPGRAFRPADAPGAPSNRKTQLGVSGEETGDDDDSNPPVVEQDTVWSILLRVSGAFNPMTWSWPCCYRLGASGLGLAVLETWQIAGVLLTRPASAGTGTGYMAFWGGVASATGLDFAPAFRWGQAPTLFILLAVLLLAAMFVGVAEFCIQPASAEDIRTAHETEVSTRGRQRRVSSPDPGESDPSTAPHATTTPVYSPKYEWMVSVLRMLVTACVALLAFAAARESFDVVSCHARTGRDVVLRSSGGVGLNSFEQDNPDAVAAAAATSANS